MLYFTKTLILDDLTHFSCGYLFRTVGQTLTVSYVFMLPQQNENSHHERTTVNQAYQYYNVADPQEPPTGASPQHSAGREK